MMGLADCIVQKHDIGLVAASVLVCVLTAFVTFTLYGRAKAGEAAFRPSLIALMAATSAIGTWTTHIVAMLAYRSLVPVSYDAGLTALSLALTILVMGGGLATAVLTDSMSRRVVGGAMAGFGIGTMHYTGMAAISFPGHISIDPQGVVRSLILGSALSALALATAGDGRRWGRLLAAGLILGVAVAALHFTGMASVTVTPDLTVPFDEGGLTTSFLSAMALVGTASLLIVGLGSLHLERRSAHQGERRVHDLADAALEGIVFSHGGFIADANAAFCTLAGTTVHGLRGRRLGDMLTDETTDKARAGCIEANLVGAGGEPIPVAVIAREVGTSLAGREVHIVRDLRQQRESEGRIRFLAHHDALTGLPNRVTFGTALDKVLAKTNAGGAPVSVFCLDLDRFKWVNDTLGHAVGDLLLQAVTRRIVAVTGPDAVVSRMGGDEFALVHLGDADGAASGRLAQAIIDAVAPSYEIEGHSVSVGVTIGIASAPVDATQGPGLLKAADMALYRAKAEGRGLYRHFEAGMDERMQQRRLLESDLRRAIPAGEMAMHYQPLVDVGTEAIVGFEALMRWESPTRGMVPPGDFIPLAEEIGLIVELGDWSIRQACADAATWEGDPRVVVNLSPLHFRGGDVVATVEGAIRASGIDPRRIELEITESLLLVESGDVLETLRRLKALGVRIAMDDFGTGYSSLGYLRRFPFDKIKIDRSFVTDMGSNAESLAIVRAVTGLGHSLGLQVVAEGVETREQMGHLRREGCTEAQGYLFSRPIPASSVAGMLVPRREAVAA